MPTAVELDRVLTSHLVWMERGGAIDPSVPGRGRLCRADLSGADLSGADLPGADLSAARLIDADLSGASLFEADLSGALLLNADLSGAILTDADLSGAGLADADLSGAELLGTDLSGADLIYADLTGADLTDADLSGASLFSADLPGASLFDANLSGAHLVGADLSGAGLFNADLSGADLFGADLSSADLTDADLSGVILANATLAGALFQSVGSPERDSLYDIEGLDQVEFLDGRESAVVGLRNQLREAGQRNLERAATYALERNRMRHNFASDDPLDWLSAIISAVFFWLPAAFGLDHGRPLAILVVGTVIMALPYAWYAWRPSTRQPQYGGSAIYRVFPDGRIVEDAYGVLSEGAERVERVKSRSYLAGLPIGLYVSFLSSFRIGFRTFNIGTWASRLQKREYEYRVIGWPRVLAGAQSVFSLYMLIAWLLFTFGRPLQ